MLTGNNLREAVKEGFDDAAFADRAGRISEATIWNLVFWDGEAIVWPDADVLPGVTMTIVRRQLDVLGVSQRQVPITTESLGKLRGAAVMNSWTPGVAVNVIGASKVPISEPFVELLHRAYWAEPAVKV